MFGSIKTSRLAWAVAVCLSATGMACSTQQVIPEPQTPKPRPDAQKNDAGLGIKKDAGHPSTPSDSGPSVIVDSGHTDHPLVTQVCDGSYSPVQVAGHIADPALVEASGLAASRQHAGVLWAHNDSGDTARLFALGSDGRALGHLNLPGVDAFDFEDISLGLCPDQNGDCLWIADIGDNLHQRDKITIIVTPEPSVSLDESIEELDATQIWRFPCAYPDGAKDAEALIVAPDASTFYIVEKIGELNTRLFKHPGPLVADQKVNLEFVTTFASPGLNVQNGGGYMVTAADLHPAGTRLLIRTYSGVFEYRFQTWEDLNQLDLFTHVLVTIGPISEPQGESVSYDHAGTGLWTLSEDVDRSLDEPLHHYDCVSASQEQ